MIRIYVQLSALKLLKRLIIMKGSFNLGYLVYFLSSGLVENIIVQYQMMMMMMMIEA